MTSLQATGVHSWLTVGAFIRATGSYWIGVGFVKLTSLQDDLTLLIILHIMNENNWPIINCLYSFETSSYVTSEVANPKLQNW